MFRIIDAHIHEFNPELFRVLWIEDVPELNRPIPLAEYHEALSCHEDYEVVQAVHIELDTIEEHRQKENSYFIQAAYDTENIISALIISADMMSNNLMSYLQGYIDEPVIKGVRHILHVPSQAPGTCLKKEFVENVHHLGELDMIFEGCFRADDLYDFYNLARECCDTRFVLNHMGLVDITAFDDENPSDYVSLWKDNIAKLASLPNVSCKVSGLSSSEVGLIAPAVNHCFDNFGEERVMFASNFPVCTLDITLNEWIASLITIAGQRGKSFSEKFFSLNAEKIYSIGR